MTDKEFKRLSRADLIEIIYQMQEDADKLEQEKAQLQAQLYDRSTKIEKAGSIAEATVALNGLFEAAQATADSYLAEIAQLRSQAEEKLAAAEKTCKAVIAVAEKKAQAIIDEAEQKRNAMQK